MGLVTGTPAYLVEIEILKQQRDEARAERDEARRQLAALTSAAPSPPAAARAPGTAGPPSPATGSGPPT